MEAYSIDKPRFHLLAGEIADVDQYVAKLRFETGARIAIRVLRGKEMKDMDGFYDELAAALQFPLYFGRNWNALDESLVDLEWLPSNAYLLVFADSPSVLKGAEEGDADAFWKLLSRSSDEWASGASLGGGLERKPTPFHVVLHAEVAEADHFLHRVEAAIGETVSRLAASVK
jgi:RNAse (barnase) inhibitor barstar